MTRMTPEEELLAELRREYAIEEVEVEPSSVDYFRRLEERFPMWGSKIDWDHVPRSRTLHLETSDSEVYFNQAEALANEIWSAAKIDFDRQVVVIGDSATEVALKMRLQVLQSCLRRILTMPQHTYVLAPDASWCMAFTMEGDVCFGYAPGL